MTTNSLKISEDRVDMSRYAAPVEDNKVQTEVCSVKTSRMSLYGTVPIDAFRVMDKRKFSIVADVTLDEVSDVIDQIFVNLQLCDMCDEPATRVGTIKVDDSLDAPKEFACESCKFSQSVISIKPTTAAESIHRAKALLLKLIDRR